MSKILEIKGSQPQRALQVQVYWNTRIRLVPIYFFFFILRKLWFFILVFFNVFPCLNLFPRLILGDWSFHIQQPRNISTTNHCAFSYRKRKRGIPLISSSLCPKLFVLFFSHCQRLQLSSPKGIIYSCVYIYLFFSFLTGAINYGGNSSAWIRLDCNHDFCIKFDLEFNLGDFCVEYLQCRMCFYF